MNVTGRGGYSNFSSENRIIEAGRQYEIFSSVKNVSICFMQTVKRDLYTGELGLPSRDSHYDFVPLVEFLSSPTRKSLKKALLWIQIILMHLANSYLSLTWGLRSTWLIEAELLNTRAGQTSLGIYGSIFCLRSNLWNYFSSLVSYWTDEINCWSGRQIFKNIRCKRPTG